jgi:thiosulfate dehydrogenase
MAVTGSTTRIASLLAVAGAAVFAIAAAFAQSASPRPSTPVVTWDIPNVDQLPDNEEGRLARYGRSLVMATYAHIGPAVSDPQKRFAGNNLACRNCHLQGGLKKFGLLLVGAYADYPTYSKRAGESMSIEDRVNNCMTRSMNGRALPEGSRELTALVTYLKVLSTGISTGADVIGQGSGSMAWLTRAADPQRGQHVFFQKCAECHGTKGSGIRVSTASPALGYQVPPLWGPDSFNNGAGMARLITIANFVHSNMPNGTYWADPQLSPDDAWDVGAYVISQPRPTKSDLAADFPDRLSKPVDTPYGPYADGFSEVQHKYGPFGPIAAEDARLAAERPNAQKSK